MTEHLCTTTFDSPVGPLTLVASDAGLRAVLWPTERAGRVPLGEALTQDADHPVLVTACVQLAEYFAGARTDFDVPLDLRGSDLDRAVWAALDGIPFGTTASYGQQALRLGRPTAARAVGAAIGRNPVSIVLPCHRVVAANGNLTGFAGGLETKRFLLDHEARAAVE